jgi:hypothetical protein
MFMVVMELTSEFQGLCQQVMVMKVSLAMNLQIPPLVVIGECILQILMEATESFQDHLRYGNIQLT